MRQADATADTTETLVGFVEQHERHRPNDVAIHYGDRQWTWEQWASRIRQAAGALRAAGVQRGQCVAFLDKNHPGCLETLIAAVSIGAVATIANWRMTGEELVARAQRQRRTAAVRGRRTGAHRRGDQGAGPGSGTHRRGRRRQRRVRILACRSHTRCRRPGRGRQRHRPGDLQLGHHRTAQRVSC